jgi:hypothetical protein
LARIRTGDIVTSPTRTRPRAKPNDRRGTAAEHAHFGILLELVLEHGLDQRVSDVPAIASFAHGMTWAASEADARWRIEKNKAPGHQDRAFFFAYDDGGND